jgi:hypothetical protein
LGSAGLESRSELLLSGSADDLDLGESEFGVSESQRFVSSNIFSLVQLSGSEDLDVVLLGSVVAGHFHVELGDGSVQRHISEFLIDVVGQSTGRVFQSHTVGLDIVGVFFINLSKGGTSLTDKTCPTALLILFNNRICFQNLDLATTSFLAKTRMAKTWGSGTASVGFSRPVTKNYLIFMFIDLSA